MHQTLLTQVRYLALSRVVQSFGYTIVMPVLPIILLRPPFNFSVPQVGLATALYGIADRGLALFCAPFVERLGSRRSQVVGYCLVAAMFMSMAVIPMYPCVLVALVGIGMAYLDIAQRNGWAMNGLWWVLSGIAGGVVLICLVRSRRHVHSQTCMNFALNKAEDVSV